MQGQNQQPQNQSFSLAILSQKNKVDLQAIYTGVVGEVPDKALTRKQLIDAIVAINPLDTQAPVSESIIAESAPDGTGGDFFGNKDTAKKYLLQADWVNQVVVHQCQIEQMNGGAVEVPNTHQLQTYSPAIYEKLSRDEKGKPSFFSESKMKVVVLHDPR